jgi:hypothetical protein
MDEFALLSFAEGQRVPTAQELQQKLEAAGMKGEYKIVDGALQLENEDGLLEFMIFPAEEEDEFGDEGAGIDIAGELVDIAATIIDLQEILEEAFPGSEFSSAYDDFMG